MARAQLQSQQQQREGRLERMKPSAIRDIHNLGEELRAQHPDREFIALHFGEGDLGTPEFIVEAGVDALRSGAVFYENNAGRPDLTAALSRYHSERLGVALAPGNFLVTSGGVQAIHLAMLGLLSPGDAVINITPAWPNFREAAVIAGAEVHDLPLRFERKDSAAGIGKFRLDRDAMRALADSLPRLRMIVVNSPSNPTGNVLDAGEQEALLSLCRERDIWLLADEMYDRIVFATPAPPSFLQLARPGDRLVVINGFSKTYAMTGWRLGYLITETDLAARLAAMQEFVTSCAPAMAQVAAITALTDGEAYVAESLTRYRRLRDLTVAGLRSLGGVTVAQPDGAFYAFFKAPGSEDSIAFCQKFLTASGVLLAPGAAFGSGGEGWLRLCFAKESTYLEQAIGHLRDFLT